MDIQVKKLSKYEWEIPKSGAMKVPARVYASEEILSHMKKDITLQQLKNVATLPGIQKFALALPDAHQGYGFPVGAVAAFDMDTGVVCPGGIGYDINCSVRLLRTDLNVNEFLKKRTQILDKLFLNVPSGVGRAGKVGKLSRDEFKEVLQQGARWAVSKGYGNQQDWKKTEEEGCLKSADASYVSHRAIDRGASQLGSLGSGNHFLEVQQVDEIYNEKVAREFGITQKGQVTIMIHCGSRGLGHQVASDYIKLMEDKYGFKDLPDRELVNSPITSELGQRYLAAMNAAANFGFCNKQMITHWVRESFAGILPSTIEVVYDVCHNIAKMERHTIDGEEKEVCVHRKGATRSFGAGRKEVPETYRDVGQPILIPGSMGTASYVLVGTNRAEEVSFGTTAHGAGRVSSRSAALRMFKGEEVKKELAKRGIEIKAGSLKGIAEEAPEVYKNIDDVVKVSHELGIGNMVARLRPVAVIKG